MALSVHIESNCNNEADHNVVAARAASITNRGLWSKRPKPQGILVMPSKGYTVVKDARMNPFLLELLSCAAPR